jgi:16S rRNA (cytosine967-C5)-methyltransferase
MSRFYSHVNTAKLILNSYKGEIPLSAFLKNFFSKEKKYGARDRRNISSLCYNYYRTGFALAQKDIEQRLLTSVFVCEGSSDEWLQNVKPQWNEKISVPLAEKIKIAKLDTEKIFPFIEELSDGISVSAFNTSFLIQPDVFARIRPGKHSSVKKRLSDAAIPFNEVDHNSLAFANGTKLESVLDINKEIVIQDLNSQKVGELLLEGEYKKPTTVWDCCAASGGKSIMTYDLLSNTQLTVSDIRDSIIKNLRTRFKEAGIKDFRTFVADLTDSGSLQNAIKTTKFDLVICDAPCSGSGTWARTPEQVFFFKKEEILRYSNLQKSIAANSSLYVKKGGYFLYVTCSVFRKENEEVVDFIKRQTNFSLIEMRLLKGYEEKADTMFAALFRLI